MKLADLGLEWINPDWNPQVIDDEEFLALERAISALIERERADAVTTELAKVVGFSTIGQKITLHRDAEALREVIMSRGFDRTTWVKGVEIK